MAKAKKKKKTLLLASQHLLDGTQRMPSLLIPKICLDHVCFIQYMMRDFTSPVRMLQQEGVCGWAPFSERRCLLLPGLVPWLGFLPCRVQKQVGTEACQPQSDGNWKKRRFTNAFVFMPYLPLTAVWQQDERGCWQDYSLKRWWVLLTTNLCHFFRLSQTEKTDCAMGGLAWPGAVYRTDISICKLPYAPRTLCINREMSTKMSFSWNIF